VIFTSAVLYSRSLRQNGRLTRQPILATFLAVHRANKYRRPPRLAALGLGTSIAAAVLAGCGGAQSPIDAPAAMPQTSSIAMPADRSESWMLPEAKSEDLIYFSGYVGSGATVYVYAYYSGKLVGTLTGFNTAHGLCADRSGNVFVTEFSGQDIVEYGHGSTKPKMRLSDEGFAPNGCSVDPTSGDLAVANYCGKSASDCVGSNEGDLLVYPEARGTPKRYHMSAVWTYSFCTYDSTGNLYADGSGPPSGSPDVLVRLSLGGEKLIPISLNQSFDSGVSVQWDGTDIVVGDAVYFSVLDQFSIKGTRGTKVGSTSLPNNDVYQVGLMRNKVLASTSNYRKSLLEFFDYPAGGTYTRRFQVADRPYAITVSSATR